MPNYQNSKIYKLTSPHTNKIYIGSTTQKYLSDRKSGHIRDYKNYGNGKIYLNRKKYIMKKFSLRIS